MEVQEYDKSHIWRPSRISELTPIIFDMELPDLSSKASIYTIYGNTNYYHHEF